MKRHPQQSREEYEQTQLARTAAKWTFSGITREEVEWIADKVPAELLFTGNPILCLGVRNGAEVDFFREVFGDPVQGVELHPQGARADVWTGSFDAMPEEWAGRFALLYSNAFDHAWDPEATAREWMRVAAPGAILALTLPIFNEPTETDPIADVTIDDVRALFPGATRIDTSLRWDRIYWSLWRLP